ncbi:DUF1127 domain-containing protein [uncultured Agrobacterium sp.]|uniref:DUF1127 domain-containing protein n=1 Tax=uncultured Agrobacterium sp. TaxID=157277 RepID=UPI002587018D|nr:DUF1127 domain-containing protein [uncultured Agrobacterium sp.]
MRTAERKMELQLTAPHVSFWSRAGVTREGVFKLVRSIANRIAVNKLTEMDDYQLADIGLVRADVMDALEMSLLDDPALHLARAAKMRAGTRFLRLRKS